MVAVALALQDAKEERVAFQADRGGRDLEDRRDGRDRRRRSPGGCFGLTERMTNHIAQPFCVSAKSARDFCVGFYFNTYFLGFSRVVTRICLWPCSRCIFAEYNLALNKYEGYLASKFT